MLMTVCCTIASAQINYTHRTARLGIDDGVIVVPNIARRNHLWIIPPQGPLKLQVYNEDLEWLHQEEVPLKLISNNDITILPFDTAYFLYNQTAARGKNFLWKVSASGNVVNESDKMKALIKSSFNDTNITCQLFSRGKHLFLLGNMYYPELKKVITTIVKTDNALQKIDLKRYAYDFNHSYESLQKILIEPEQNMLVLKKHIDVDSRYILDIVKINLQTSAISEANFYSSVPFNNPEVIYNPTDFTTTVYAQLSRTFFTNKFTRNMFFATLNDTLDQKTPPSTVRVTIDDEMYGAFTCINLGNGYSKWLPVHGVWNSLYDNQVYRRLMIGLSSIVSLEGSGITIINASSYQPKIQPIDPHLQFVAPPGDVRFSVIDRGFRRIKDTVFKYQRRNFIEVAQYSSFTQNNNNYLLVKERFPSKGKGLLLMHLNDKGVIAPWPIRLYDRYHYALPQMQQSGDGKVTMPYVYRGEVGLVNFGVDVSE